MNYTIHKKETFYFNLMTVISIALYALIGVGIYVEWIEKTTILGYICAMFLLSKLISLLVLGHLRGNAIKVTEKQFPEIDAIVKQHAQTLQCTTVPETYILQGNGVLNAFATRLFKRNFVILYSDVLEVAYQEGMEAVSFIIGHELGHIKRDHLNHIKNMLILPASYIPFLNWAYSRAREYTCDNIGFALCPHAASKGLLLLAAGKKLYTHVSVEELLTQHTHKGVATWCAEIFSTHPLLLKRIESINKQYYAYINSDASCFVQTYTSKHDTTQLQ